jgi:hypothetical protein
LLDQVRPLRDRGWQRRTTTCLGHATLPRRAFDARRQQRSSSALGTGPTIGGARQRLGRPVDHRIDDSGVVDIGVDDVIRRRRDIDRLPDIDRDRHKERLRQDEQSDRCQWRRQDDEIRRWRRQEKYRRRRWRRKIEFRIAEHLHGAIDVDDFLRRGRQHVIVDDRK